MSIQTIGSGAGVTAGQVGGRFFLAGAAEFADKLSVGQILKGRVLRQYEGSKYAVAFDGQERVVDSAVPLKTGELIYGRVIGLSDRVELQRVYQAEGADSAEAPLPNAGETVAFGYARPGSALDETLARYRVDLTAADRVQLEKTVRTAADGNAMAMAGAMLSKLGLRQAPELLWSLYSAMTRAPTPAGTDSDAALAVPVPIAAAGGVAVKELADALRTAMDDPKQGTEVERDAAEGTAEAPAAPGENPVPANGVRDEGDRARNGQQEEWAQRLLNAQTGGVVAHRSATLPLMVGDRLVEVDVALFEQRRDGEQKPAGRHRQLVFALATESLGAVEVRAQVIGDRVRVRVIGESSDKTDAIAAHAESLRQALGGTGWVLDEVSYETRDGGGANGPACAVVAHVVSQDSLNRLV